MKLTIADVYERGRGPVGKDAMNTVMALGRCLYERTQDTEVSQFIELMRLLPYTSLGFNVHELDVVALVVIDGQGIKLSREVKERVRLDIDAESDIDWVVTRVLRRIVQEFEHLASECDRISGVLNSVKDKALAKV